MQLKAIELREVGTFTAPVRIDGLAPGLNVLAGANELGKSTLLRGLTALFTEGHRTTKQSVRDLRPYTGGAPMVGCTFELLGATWRLEKQFLSAHRALLQRMDGGEVHQGADAENRLVELLGESGLGASLSLLWVEQGSGFDVPALSDGVQHSLAQLLAAQADVTAGVGPAGAVLKAVNAELDKLVVKSGKAKKHSSYDKLLVDQADVAERLRVARGKVADAEQRMQRLAELQEVARALSDRAATVAMQEGIGELEKRLRAAQDAQRQVQQVNERVSFLEKQRQQRVAALTNYDDGRAELDAIDIELGRSTSELESIGVRVDELTRVLGAIAERIDEAARDERALRLRLEQFRRARERGERRERLGELTKQRGRLAQIAAEIDQVDGQLGGLDWAQDALATVRRTAGKAEQLQVRLDAVSPRVRFHYASGRRHGFKVDGAEVGDGADIQAAGPIVIEVEGVGRIEVVPGASEMDGALERQLAATKGELADHLAAIGAVDLAEAEAREGYRGELRQRRERLISEREGLAPGGDERLALEFERLMAGDAQDDAATVGDDDGEIDELGDGVLGGSLAELHSVEAIAAALEAVQQRQVRDTSQAERLQGEKVGLEQRRAAVAAELRVRQTRRDELHVRFARTADGCDPRRELVEHVEGAEHDVNAAVRERLAVQEVTLSTADLGALERDLVAKRAELAVRGERLAAAQQEVRHLEGMLSRDFEDGTAEQDGELEGRLETLDDRVAQQQRHIAALQLLSEELDGETSRRRSEISHPLAQRLSALAVRVWPGAEVALASDMTVDGLRRDGREEPAAAVSAGTREQVAMLARLAYAGTRWDSAIPLPLILDDPLVYSDDRRLDVLFDVLAETAQVQQVIVLTCHARAFEPLIARYGATRLALSEAAVV